MKQQQFEKQHQQLWRRFDILLAQKSSHIAKRQEKQRKQQKNTQQASEPLATNPNLQNISDDNSSNNGIKLSSTFSSKVSPFEQHQQSGYEFIRLYRIICQHYALAKQRHYSPHLVHRLHEQVVAGHQLLYRRSGHIWTHIYEFFSYTFPVRLRSHLGLLWISLACFLVPAILMGWACYEQSDMLYSVMSDGEVHMMEEMYNPANDMIGRDSSRRSDTDIAMFGHYIQNNIGIDFQIYGMGIFAGIGTLFSLIYNGLVIGGVSGHLTGIGYGETFWQFVVGHGSFELTAAVISGMAGLRLAQSLFMPGNYRRMDAFKIAGKQSIELLIGAASMTFIAAFIEAFWSSSNVIPNMVKYVVAILLWLFVIGYLSLAGRKQQQAVGSL